jgi:PAS domain S-box-containing protein
MPNSPKTRRLFPLLIVALATLTIGFCFEFLKDFLFPHLTKWESQYVTIGFCTLGATLGMYVWLRRRQSLYDQITREVNERGRLEEMQAHLAERTRELEQLTQQFEVQIAERHRAEETLRESAERLRLAINVAQIGTWDWDANSGQVSSGGVPNFPLFGQDLQTYQGFFERIHPDDRESVGQAMAFSVVDEAPYNVEFRVVSPDKDEVRWIAAGGQMFRDENGKALRMIGVAQDVTERKQAEERLAEERALLRTLIDNLPDYIYVRDRDNRFLLGNASVAQVMGTTPEALVGRMDRDFFPTDLATEFHADDVRVMESGQPLINKEEINIDPTGVKRWVLTNKVPLRDKSGSIIGVIGIGRDITERKRMESALLESQARLDDIVRSLQDVVVWSYTAEGFETLYMSSAIEKIFGRAMYEFFENHRLWSDCIHPEDAHLKYNFLGTILREGSQEREYRIVRPDGEVRWLHDRGMRVCDSHGKPLRIDGVATDITERKRAQERLAEERNLLRTLIDHLPHYIYVKDTEGRFVLDNVADALAMGAKSPEEVVGKTNFDLCLPDLAEKYHRDDMTVIHTGEPLINVEEPAVNEHGEHILILTSKWPLRNHYGQTIGLVGISMDMTERKRGELQAIELGTQRARTKMLADFVRDASHDFRTPLSTINTGLYLLRKVTDPERQLERIKMIEQQTAHLTRLVDGLLTMTRLDSEAVFRFHPLNMNRLMQDIQMRMSPLASENQVRLKLELDEHLPQVQADAGELGMALMKLVENAVHFTPAEETITLRTRMADGRLVAEVCDPGAGIHPSDLPHIFERFYRADKARSAQTGGVGLGLSIARKIVEAHGGDIEVESILGQGSVFRVMLPVMEPEQSPNYLT